MLLYERMCDYLYDKLNCKIYDAYTQKSNVVYVRFQTKEGIECLLHINKPMSEPVQSKTTMLVESTIVKEAGYDYAINKEGAIVKRVQSNTDPSGYVDVIKRLNPSMTSTAYTVAVLTSEYLIIDDHVYDVASVVKSPPRFLIVLDLNVLVERNILVELVKVNASLNDILTASSAKYAAQLKTLLQKCSDVKILTNKIPKLDALNILDREVLLHEAQKALNLSLDIFTKI